MGRVKRGFNWFILILIGVGIYFSYTVVKQQIHLNAVADEKRVTELHLTEEKNLNKELNEEKAKLNDPAYVEKIAREELGMVKQGEMPYVSSKK
ncbi:MAG: septum formation initiator family protein [Selenomonadaceae bacterium]